jgi:hypothetical protein
MKTKLHVENSLKTRQRLARTNSVHCIEAFLFLFFPIIPVWKERLKVLIHRTTKEAFLFSCTCNCRKSIDEIIQPHDQSTKMDGILRESRD